jgi:hypothetical protein
MHKKLISSILPQRIKWLDHDKYRVIKLGFDHYDDPQEEVHFPIAFDEYSGYSVPSDTGSLQLMADYSLKNLDISQRQTFLDLGYGFGDACLAMNGIFRKIIGIDYKQRLKPVVEERTEKLKDYDRSNGFSSHSNFHFMQGDYFNLENYRQFGQINVAFTFPSLLNMTQIFNLEREVIVPLDIKYWFINFFEIAILEDMLFYKLEQGGYHDRPKVFSIKELSQSLFLLEKIEQTIE